MMRLQMRSFYTSAIFLDVSDVSMINLLSLKKESLLIENEQKDNLTNPFLSLKKNKHNQFLEET